MWKQPRKCSSMLIEAVKNSKWILISFFQDYHAILYLWTVKTSWARISSTLVVDSTSNGWQKMDPFSMRNFWCPKDLTSLEVMVTAIITIKDKESTVKDWKRHSLIMRVAILQDLLWLTKYQEISIFRLTHFPIWSEVFWEKLVKRLWILVIKWIICHLDLWPILL